MDYILLGFAWILAVDALLTAWFYGSIFQKPFEMFERWEEDSRSGIKRWFGELFTCPMCLSYHVTFWYGLIFLGLPALFLPYPYEDYAYYITYSLAVTDIVHWLQGVRSFRESEDDKGSSESTGS